jgi:hypothetical protein
MQATGLFDWRVPSRVASDTDHDGVIDYTGLDAAADPSVPVMFTVRPGRCDPEAAYHRGLLQLVVLMLGVLSHRLSPSFRVV